MKRAEIEEQNRYLLRLQYDFRRAADIVTDALMTFEEVEAIAVVGSVAKSLWKEVPRFREFRCAGIEVWHNAKLSIWRFGFRRSSGSVRCVAPGIRRCAGDMRAEEVQALLITKSKSF